MTLEEAKMAAFKVGCFVVTKPDCFLLYREAKPQNALIGKRKDEKAIVALVKKACMS